MVKVVKIYLIPAFRHRDGTEIEYKDTCKILRDLQKEIRIIKNKTIQDCWEWKNFCADYKEKNGEYPQPIDFLKSAKGEPVKTLTSFIYGKHINDGYKVCARSYGEAIRIAENKYNDDYVDILKGNKNIISYKANQPIPVTKQGMELHYNEDEKNFYITISLFSVKGAKELNLPTALDFRLWIKDKSTRTIVERCFDEVYGMAGSNLFYDEKKRMFRLNLSFDTKTSVKWEDTGKILGVKISLENPVTAIVTGKTKPFIVEGGELERIRNNIEKRRISMSKQRAVCADGSIGHGYKTRMKPVNAIGDKIARYRDTYNHNISRGVVDYAQKMGCSSIQLEDLTGIAENDTYLKKWSYYDLQTKIKYKAAEKGIKTFIISRKHLNERCCKCGCVCSANIADDNKFKCISCDWKSSIDYNSAQNLSIKDVDKAIEYDILLNSRCSECGKFDDKAVKTDGKFVCKCGFESTFEENRKRNLETKGIAKIIDKELKSRKKTSDISENDT